MNLIQCVTRFYWLLLFLLMTWLVNSYLVSPLHMFLVIPLPLPLLRIPPPLSHTHLMAEGMVEMVEAVVERTVVAIIVKFMVILKPTATTKPETNQNQRMLPRSLILPPLRMSLSPPLSIMISFIFKQPNKLPRLLQPRLSLVIL